MYIVRITGAPLGATQQPKHIALIKAIRDVGTLIKRRQVRLKEAKQYADGVREGHPLAFHVHADTLKFVELYLGEHEVRYEKENLAFVPKPEDLTLVRAKATACANADDYQSADQWSRVAVAVENARLKFRDIPIWVEKREDEQSLTRTILDSEELSARDRAYEEPDDLSDSRYDTPETDSLGQPI